MLIRADAPKAPRGARRSPQWAAFRRAFLKGKACANCGSKKQLEAHHVVPFHLAPELELVTGNLIALCEHHDCHLLVGHLGDYRAFNPTVREDAAWWRQRMQARRRA